MGSQTVHLEAGPAEATIYARERLGTGARIENLRTSLITYPENGRLPKLVEGVRRNPGVADFIAALSDPKATIPPALLTALGDGKKDGHEDLDSGVGDRELPAGVRVVSRTLARGRVIQGHWREWQ